MKKTAYYIVLCFVIIITGCHSVFTSHPMGDNPIKIAGEKWNGTWINKDGSVVVKVTDPEKGYLIAALIESKKNDLLLQKYDIELRGTNNFTFINFKLKDEKGNIRYVWGKIKKDDKTIFIWSPNIDKFRGLVNTKKLPGEVKNKDVYLNTLKDEHVKFIMSEKNALLFDLDKPSVFYRLSK